MWLWVNILYPKAIWLYLPIGWMVVYECLCMTHSHIKSKHKNMLEGQHAGAIGSHGPWFGMASNLQDLDTQQQVARLEVRCDTIGELRTAQGFV